MKVVPALNASDTSQRIFKGLQADRRFLLCFFLVLAVGFLVRAQGLGRESIWWDEFTSVMHLQPPSAWQASPDYARWNQQVIRETAPSLMAFWRQNRTLDPATMPLYYTFEYLWNRYLDNDWASLRWLSILIGMLLLPAAFALGAVFYGRWAGLLTMACVALSPIHVQFSREIRMYGLMTLLAALSILTWVMLVRTGRVRWWLANGAVALFLLWTHPFAILVPFVQGLCWLILFPRDFNRLFLWGIWMVLAFVPITVYVMSIRFWQRDTTDSWMRIPLWHEFLGDLFGDDAIGATYQLYATDGFWKILLPDDLAVAVIRARWTIAKVWMAFTIGVVLAVPLLTLWRRLRNGDARDGDEINVTSGCVERNRMLPVGFEVRWVLVLAAWMLLPPLVLLTASWVWRPCIMPRYTLHASLALYVLISGLVTLLPGRGLKAAVTAGVLIFFAYQQTLLWGGPQHPDWLRARQTITEQGNPDDILLVHNWLWKRVFAWNLGPSDHVVSYGDKWDSLAAIADYVCRLELQSGHVKSLRAPWIILQTDYFATGPIPELEARLSERGLTWEYWEYPAIQNVALYRVSSVQPENHLRGEFVLPRPADPAERERFAKEFADLSLEFWRNGEYETATAVARTATEIDPEYVTAWSYLGMALKEMNAVAEAIEAFQRSTALNPSAYPWDHLNLAQLLMVREDYAGALEAVREGLKLLPNDSWAHTVHGMALEGLGRLGEAAESYARAAELDPSDARPRDALETIRRKLGAQDNAGTAAGDGRP